jgi:large subunit ribosomal protein L13
MRKPCDRLYTSPASRYITRLATPGLTPAAAFLSTQLAHDGGPVSGKVSLMSTTYLSKPGEIEPKWFVVDAKDQVLGRLASRLATVIQGKHKATYTPHVLSGDHVIVLNADQVRVTGRKAEVLEYDNYTRYTGGRRVTSYRTMNERHPERVIQLAVKRMLPKSKLGRDMLLKLKVYNGTQHPHAAQRPEALPAK